MAVRLLDLAACGRSTASTKKIVGITRRFSSSPRDLTRDNLQTGEGGRTCAEFRLSLLMEKHVRITSLMFPNRTGLSVVVGAFVIACAAFFLAMPSEALAAAYGVNLIVNGNAEAGPSSITGGPVTVPGWTTSSAFTVVPYGAPGGFPASIDPGPSDRQNQFFSGGNAASSTGHSGDRRYAQRCGHYSRDGHL